MFNELGLVQGTAPPARVLLLFRRGFKPLTQQVQGGAAFFGFQVAGVDSGLFRVDIITGQGFQCVFQPGHLSGFERLPEAGIFGFGSLDRCLGLTLQGDVVFDLRLVEPGEVGLHVSRHKGQRLLLRPLLARQQCGCALRHFREKTHVWYFRE